MKKWYPTEGRRIIDKYTKFILTMIAVGILGLNYHLFKGGIISEVQASSHEVHKISICNESGSRCADIGIVDQMGKAWQVLMTRG